MLIATFVSFCNAFIKSENLFKKYFYANLAFFWSYSLFKIGMDL